jgi:nitrogen fixation NifU-like protein
MTDKRALYEQVIVDHNKNPRNFREMEDPTGSALGHNPLCGDILTVYVRMEGDRIADVSFTGSGCAISKSSASIMTSVVKGKTRQEAGDLFVKFHRMVTSDLNDAAPTEDLGKLEALRGVREYPVRVKCATLAWHALAAAIEGNDRTVRTE